MSFWKSIFKNANNKPQEENINNEISSKFREWVIKSINLIGVQGREMENDELYEFLIKNGIPEIDAGEIIIFLPPAFCRKLLPEIKWQPNYIDYYSNEKQVKRKYSENKRYVIIEQETENYWNAFPSNEVVLNIAGRAAEFKAINQMLNNGGKLEDVELAESYVIRY